MPTRLFLLIGLLFTLSGCAASQSVIIPVFEHRALDSDMILVTAASGYSYLLSSSGSTIDPQTMRGDIHCFIPYKP